MNAIEHLEKNKWVHPDSYYGHEPDGYCIAGQSRDSDALERSNYECIFKDLLALNEKLQGYNDEPFVYDFRARHWAVGWVETIIVTTNAPDELKHFAGEILCALSDYPVYNDEHFSELEYNEANAYWHDMSVSERIELCKKANQSIFSARREYPPSNNDYIYETLINY